MRKITFTSIILFFVCYFAVGQISRTITTNPSDFLVEKVGEYDKIFINKELNAIDIVGHPELPVYIQSFVIPRDAQLFGVTVSNINKQKVAGIFNVFPAQPPRPVSMEFEEEDFVLPDPEIYNSQIPYSGKQAEIISDDIYLGYRIVSVKFYPIEYIPKAKELLKH